MARVARLVCAEGWACARECLGHLLWGARLARARVRTGPLASRAARGGPSKKRTSQDCGWRVGSLPELLIVGTDLDSPIISPPKKLYASRCHAFFPRLAFFPHSYGGAERGTTCRVFGGVHT